MNRRGDTGVAYLFLTPFLIVTAVFFVFAFARAFYYGFTDFNLFNTPKLIGLKPYADVLHDPNFLRALANSLIFSVVVTTAQTIFALLMAVALNRKLAGLSFFRAAWYMPSITSSVVITLIFLWLFQQRGVVNYLVTQAQTYAPYIWTLLGIFVLAQIVQVLLERARRLPASWFDPALMVVSLLVALVVTVGLSVSGVIHPRPVPVFEFQYFANKWVTLGGVQLVSVPLLVIMLQNTFTTVPTLMLFFLAGLQNIPGALYEAARIDGATPWQQLTRVTVPMLRPVTFYIVTVGLIGTLQMFDQVAIIAGAAPLYTIITLAYYVYDNTFQAGVANVNLASAAAIILAAITLIFVFIQRRFFYASEVEA